MNSHTLRIDVVSSTARTTSVYGDVRWWMHWRHQISKTLYGWRKNVILLLKKIETRWIKWRMAWSGLAWFKTSSIMCCMKYLQGSCEKSRRKVSTKSIKSWFQLKKRLYHFQMKRECSIDKHMNRHTKLLINLINVNVKIDEEDKTVIVTPRFPRIRGRHCNVYT